MSEEKRSNFVFVAAVVQNISFASNFDILQWQWIW